MSGRLLVAVTIIYILWYVSVTEAVHKFKMSLSQQPSKLTMEMYPGPSIFFSGEGIGNMLDKIKMSCLRKLCRSSVDSTQIRSQNNRYQFLSECHGDIQEEFKVKILEVLDCSCSNNLLVAAWKRKVHTHGIFFKHLKTMITYGVSQMRFLNHNGTLSLKD